VKTSMPSPLRNRGLTLIELMITLAVATILTLTTVPAYTSMIERNEVASSVNAFVSELRFARSEALKRVATVSICPTANGVDCNTATSPWMPSGSSAHLIFVDSDGDGTFDTADDTVLKLTPAAFAAVSVSATGGEKFFSFSQKGIMTVPNPNLQYSTSSSVQRCLSVSLTGRSSVEHGVCS